jgi:DNA-binding transcriptional LysR family regulator
MRVELRQLRYFVAVAEALHFGRAAERLHISTPTLSQQIKAVEREVGAPLLIRHSRGVRLTAAGEVLLRTAKEALRAADEALRETRRAAGVADPVLRFGLLNGVPPWLPGRIEELLAEHVPGCRMTMLGSSTAQQLAMLESGEVDLALLRMPTATPAGVRQVRLADEEFGVLMAAANPLAAHEAVDPVALSGRELILFAREFAPDVHDSMVERLRALGADVVLSESAMPHAQLRAVLPLRPDAFSLSSARAAAPPDLVWRPLRTAQLSMSYAAAWRVDARNPALQAIIPSLTRNVSPRRTSLR